MDKFMSWMTDSFAPKVNKIAKNAWVASIQDAILTAMPMIFYRFICNYFVNR